MTFQDTRLYELCFWMIGCSIGAALALLCWFLLVPLYDSPSTMLVYAVSGESEISSRAHELRSMSEISDHQLDELISLDKRLQERVQAHYQKRMEAHRMHKYIGFSVLALLVIILIFLSIRPASPMISLVLAAWSVSVSMLFSGFELGRLPIYLLITGASIALWYFYGRKKTKKKRYIILQVIAAVALAMSLFLCAEAIEEYLFSLLRPEIVKELAIVHDQANTIAEKRKTLWRERQELLTKDVLSKQEKRNYFALEKEIVRLGNAYMQPFENSSAAQKKFEYIVHQEVVYLLLITLCVLLASLIPCPLFIQFGFILAAIFGVLRYETLAPFYTNSTISNAYIVLLALLLCFCLYRQHRYCS